MSWPHDDGLIWPRPVGDPGGDWRSCHRRFLAISGLLNRRNGLVAAVDPRPGARPTEGPGPPPRLCELSPSFHRRRIAWLEAIFYATRISVPASRHRRGAARGDAELVVGHEVADCHKILAVGVSAVAVYQLDIRQRPEPVRAPGNRIAIPLGTQTSKKTCQQRISESHHLNTTGSAPRPSSPHCPVLSELNRRVRALTCADQIR